ncbi:hypothetical protein MMA231_03984 (plasmid) [Asticcacaulis sp. MM231]|uniref:hypothetical protein n=1 Tax=Asticcacaulis sp. MM231 TaxID=3157666 RepID=UPI0032D58E21
MQLLSSLLKIPVIAGLVPRISDSFQSEAEALAKKLNLAAQAREEGVENRPHSSETSLDKPQHQIVEEIRSRVSQLKQLAVAENAKAIARIRSATAETINVELILAQIGAEVSKVKLAMPEKLETARLTERKKLKHLRKFKADNRLRRSAHYARVPSSPSKVRSML